ncbi:MAG: GNAT family N-acetyltransferase [Bdellovibrio sp.]|nr:GNAT family N-acetyltransferase [Bdellovibrio sp.]
MKLNVDQNPTTETITFFDKKIEEFNLARWNIKEKVPIAVTIHDSSNMIVGGVAAKTFGLWLLIDNLWISESLRGQGLGSQVLLNLEEAARKRGCQYALLDTLEFQARPFYEKHRYKVKWTQENYPKTGAKFFMVKEL